MRLASFLLVVYIIIIPSLQAMNPGTKDLILVEKDQKWGIINDRGAMLVPCIYDYLKITCSSLILAKKEGKIGYIDRDGNVKIDFIYESTTGFYGQKAVVTENHRDRFINEKGKSVFKKDYQQASIFSEGLAGVNTTGLWGFIDEKGKTIISPRFDFVMAFENGYCVVLKNHKFGLIDRVGKVRIPFEYDGIISSGIPGVYKAYKKLQGALLKVEKDTCKDLLERTAYRFISVEPYSFYSSACEDRQAIDWLLFKDDTMGFVNVNTGKVLCCYDKITPLSLNYFSCMKYSKEGTPVISIIDSSGTVAGNFEQYNVHKVCDSILIVNSNQGGLLGGVTLSKDTILDFVYEDILGMKKGILLVQRRGEYYLMNLKEERLSGAIPFDRISSCVFYKHMIVFKTGEDKYGMLDYEGNIIQQPEFDRIIGRNSEGFSG